MYKENFGHSQNFLSDPYLVKRLVSKADIRAVDLVIDIGFGKGIITKELLNKAGLVMAIESDPQLYSKLSKSDKLQKYNLNFLEFTLPKTNYIVFSNIPFNHSSRILKKLYLSDNLSPQISYLFLQKEVYEKYSGKNKETQLSLFLKPFYTFNFIESISSSNFSPRPKVEIVFISILKRSYPLILTNQVEEYRDFVTYGTSAWRKDVKNIFKNVFTYPQLKRLSKNYKFSLKANPLDLNFSQWCGLFAFYDRHVTENKKVQVIGSYKQRFLQEKKLMKVYRSREY